LVRYESLQAYDFDIDKYQAATFGKIWNQRATLTKDHKSNNQFRANVKSFYLILGCDLYHSNLAAQVSFDADLGPRSGSLDRALYTPGRVNIIGAIRGGAYVKLPREGNWLKQPRIFPKADDRNSGEPFTLQHYRGSNEKLPIIGEISILNCPKEDSLWNISLQKRTRT
jgi:hypothetical protein